MDAAAQPVNLLLVLKHDRCGHAASLPVIHPLLESWSLVETNQASKRRVAASGIDELGGLLCVHADIKHHVYHRRNMAFNNTLFSCKKIDVMSTHDDISPAMGRLYEAAVDLGLIDAGHRLTSFARLVNHLPQHVKNWEKRGPSKEIRLHCQAEFGINATWVETGKGPKRVTAALLPSSSIKPAPSHVDSNVAPGPDIRGRVPLISWVHAGVWDEAIDIYEPGYAEEWLPILQNGGSHAYALRVEGDSMTAGYGKSYPDGTIIIVNPDRRSPATGQRIIAKLKGSNKVTFKVYVEEDGRRWLKPLNPMHPPIYDEFAVLGTVVAKYEID